MALKFSKETICSFYDKLKVVITNKKKKDVIVQDPHAILSPARRSLYGQKNKTGSLAIQKCQQEFVHGKEYDQHDQHIPIASAVEFDFWAESDTNPLPLKDGLNAEIGKDSPRRECPDAAGTEEADISESGKYPDVFSGISSVSINHHTPCALSLVENCSKAENDSCTSTIQPPAQASKETKLSLHVCQEGAESRTGPPHAIGQDEPCTFSEPSLLSDFQEVVEPNKCPPPASGQEKLCACEESLPSAMQERVEPSSCASHAFDKVKLNTSEASLLSKLQEIIEPWSNPLPSFGQDKVHTSEESLFSGKQERVEPKTTLPPVIGQDEHDGLGTFSKASLLSELQEGVVSRSNVQPSMDQDKLCTIFEPSLLSDLQERVEPGSNPPHTTGQDNGCTSEESLLSSQRKRVGPCSGLLNDCGKDELNISSELSLLSDLQGGVESRSSPPPDIDQDKVTTSDESLLSDMPERVDPSRDTQRTIGQDKLSTSDTNLLSDLQETVESKNNDPAFIGQDKLCTSEENSLSSMRKRVESTNNSTHVIGEIRLLPDLHERAKCGSGLSSTLGQDKQCTSKDSLLSGMQEWVDPRSPAQTISQDVQSTSSEARLLSGFKVFMSDLVMCESDGSVDLEQPKKHKQADVPNAGLASWSCEVENCKDIERDIVNGSDENMGGKTASMCSRSPDVKKHSDGGEQDESAVAFEPESNATNSDESNEYRAFTLSTDSKDTANVTLSDEACHLTCIDGKNIYYFVYGEEKFYLLSEVRRKFFPTLSTQNLKLLCRRNGVVPKQPLEDQVKHFGDTFLSLLCRSKDPSDRMLILDEGGFNGLHALCKMKRSRGRPRINSLKLYKEIIGGYGDRHLTKKKDHLITSVMHHEHAKLVEPVGDLPESVPSHDSMLKIHGNIAERHAFPTFTEFKEDSGLIYGTCCVDGKNMHYFVSGGKKFFLLKELCHKLYSMHSTCMLHVVCKKHGVATRELTAEEGEKLCMLDVFTRLGINNRMLILDEEAFNRLHHVFKPRRYPRNRYRKGSLIGSQPSGFGLQLRKTIRRSVSYSKSVFRPIGKASSFTKKRTDLTKYATKVPEDIYEFPGDVNHCNSESKTQESGVRELDGEKLCYVMRGNTKVILLRDVKQKLWGGHRSSFCSNLYSYMKSVGVSSLHITDKERQIFSQLAGKKLFNSSVLLTEDSLDLLHKKYKEKCSKKLLNSESTEEVPSTTEMAASSTSSIVHGTKYTMPSICCGMKEIQGRFFPFVTCRAEKYFLLEDLCGQFPLLHSSPSLLNDLKEKFLPLELSHQQVACLSHLKGKTIEKVQVLIPEKVLMELQNGDNCEDSCLQSTLCDPEDPNGNPDMQKDCSDKGCVNDEPQMSVTSSEGVVLDITTKSCKLKPGDNDVTLAYGWDAEEKTDMDMHEIKITPQCDADQNMAANNDTASLSDILIVDSYSLTSATDNGGVSELQALSHDINESSHKSSGQYNSEISKTKELDMVMGSTFGNVVSHMPPESLRACSNDEAIEFPEECTITKSDDGAPGMSNSDIHQKSQSELCVDNSEELFKECLSNTWDYSQQVRSDFIDGITPQTPAAASQVMTRRDYTCSPSLHGQEVSSRNVIRKAVSPLHDHECGDSSAVVDVLDRQDNEQHIVKPSCYQVLASPVGLQRTENNRCGILESQADTMLPHRTEVMMQPQVDLNPAPQTETSLAYATKRSQSTSRQHVAEQEHVYLGGDQFSSGGLESQPRPMTVLPRWCPPPVPYHPTSDKPVGKIDPGSGVSWRGWRSWFQEEYVPIFRTTPGALDSHSSYNILSASETQAQGVKGLHTNQNSDVAQMYRMYNSQAFASSSSIQQPVLPPNLQWQTGPIRNNSWRSNSVHRPICKTCPGICVCLGWQQPSPAVTSVMSANQPIESVTEVGTNARKRPHGTEVLDGEPSRSRRAPLQTAAQQGPSESSIQDSDEEPMELLTQSFDLIKAAFSKQFSRQSELNAQISDLKSQLHQSHDRNKELWKHVRELRSKVTDSGAAADVSLPVIQQ